MAPLRMVALMRCHDCGDLSCSETEWLIGLFVGSSTNPTPLASTLRQDLPLRVSALRSRHSWYSEAELVGIKTDPRFASQSVHITYGAVVIDEDGFQWKRSRSRQDDTWCTRRGGGRSKHNTSTESEVTMNRGSSLQSRGRGSHHCSCRARPTTGLTCPQGHNCRALDRGTSESDLPTRCDHDARRLARPTQDESLWSISWWSLLILLQRLTVRVSSMWWIWRHLTDPWGCSRRPYI